jgi:ABC-2 type transport system permease protein
VILGLSRVLLRASPSVACRSVPRDSLFIPVNPAIGASPSRRSSNRPAGGSPFFILLPSICLSGFMFPFRGMPPPWAQAPGELLPTTHLCGSGAA